MSHQRKRNAVMVTKADGRRERLSRRKLEESILRTGAASRVARAAARVVLGRAYDGISTKQVERLVASFLRREGDLGVFVRYRLKDAMRRLGPAGYDFERYVAALLRAQGYDARLPDLIPGVCVQHEVDVVAERNGTVAMVECKYRNAPGIRVHLKDIMASWARYEDLLEARQRGMHAYAFTEGWVVCNTRMTDDGTAFGECKGMRLIGWRYPKDGGLEHMIDDQHLYPITILRSLTPAMQQQFAQAGIMLCHDVQGLTTVELARRTRVPYTRLVRLQRESEQVLQC